MPTDASSNYSSRITALESAASSSGAKIAYGTISGSRNYECTCDFYPVILFAIDNTTWTYISGSIRPYTYLYQYNMSSGNNVSVYDSTITWSDTSVKISTSSYWDYWCIIGY